MPLETFLFLQLTSLPAGPFSRLRLQSWENLLVTELSRQYLTSVRAKVLHLSVILPED